MKPILREISSGYLLVTLTSIPSQWTLLHPPYANMLYSQIFVHCMFFFKALYIKLLSVTKRRGLRSSKSNKSALTRFTAWPASCCYYEKCILLWVSKDTERTTEVTLWMTVLFSFFKGSRLHDEHNGGLWWRNGDIVREYKLHRWWGQAHLQ